jgi:pantoate--beta-alanine ligase
VLVGEPLALIDYLVLVHPSSLEDVPEWYRGEALLAVAGRVGTTRLIDNVPVNVGPGGGALEVFSVVARPVDAAPSPKGPPGPVGPSGARAH